LIHCFEIFLFKINIFQNMGMIIAQSIGKSLNYLTYKIATSYVARSQNCVLCVLITCPSRRNIWDTSCGTYVWLFYYFNILMSLCFTLFYKVDLLIQSLTTSLNFYEKNTSNFCNILGVARISSGPVTTILITFAI
jgi:hypothetical protein